MKRRHNWSFDLKTILKSIGYGGDKFLSPFTDRQTAIISIEGAKNKLLANLKSKCRNNVNSQNKLAIYRQVKSQSGPKEYIKSSINKSVRSTTVQLRAGCLSIDIELGRYQRIPRCKCICKQSATNCIESEIHFLFYCDKYIDLRQELMQIIDNECETNANDSDRIQFIFFSKDISVYNKILQRRSQ